MTRLPNLQLRMLFFSLIHLHKCAFAYSVSSGFSKRRLNCNLGLVFLKLLILLCMNFLAVVVQLPPLMWNWKIASFFFKGKKRHWHLTKTGNPHFSFKILIQRWTVTVSFQLFFCFLFCCSLFLEGGLHMTVLYSNNFLFSSSFCPCSLVPLPQLPGTHVRQWHCPPGSGFPADAKDQPHALYRCTVSHHHSAANST